MKNTKGITLVALVVTVIILLILAGITISQLTGSGLFSRSIQAEVEQKRAKYYEEINLEIYNEHMERAIEVKETAFIADLNNKITLKDWVSSTIKWDEELVEQEDDYKNTALFIETKDGYEIIVDVDNNKPEAKIREDYFKKAAEQISIQFNSNGGTGTMESVSISKNTETQLPENTFIRDGYNFIKWNTKPDGTGIDYTTIINIRNNITLYAQWEEQTRYLWEKFNVNTTTTYTKKTSLVGIGAQFLSSCTASDGYTFSTTGGFSTTGTSKYYGSIRSTDTDIVGKYIVTRTEIYKIISMSNISGSSYMVRADPVEAATSTTTTAKGTSTNEMVESTNRNQYPDAGIAGSYWYEYKGIKE